MAKTRIVTSTPYRSRAITVSTSVAARTMVRRGSLDMPPNTTRRGPNSCSRRALVQVSKERRDALAAPDAHRHDAPLSLASLELVRQLDREDGAGCADWMAESDRAAVRVDLLRVDLQLTDHRDGLRRESLVELYQVDVVDRHPDLLEQVLHREDRGNAHALRGDPGDSIGDPLELWRHAQLGGLRCGHHDDGSARVVDARRVTGGHPPAPAESPLEAGGARPRPGGARRVVHNGEFRGGPFLWR